MSVQVLVVDDQPLIRHSLRLIIDSAPDLVVAGEADTGEAAVARAGQLRPDVVLMDIRMPGGDGIDATRRITADPALTSTRIVVLSMFELDEYVHAALRAGASGFLLKDAEPGQLIDAIRRTHSGESLFAPSILTRLVKHYLDQSAPRTARTQSVLTDRETEVLTLVGRGLSNQEIAQALSISMGTVKTHIGSLLSKLHARDRAQLVIAAYERGLVSTPQLR
ncbi:DNA-binding response regulator, NarL/FixJ family, contains REC and HTH domains [Micromonospora pallida]|uniref:DNA-binding response regulator, NarL/FixJ family, contains REC and HTH domains n=1 Tax=Micromonospora pallida TaxID=145854 RepID=A0A1C6SJW7_9ACTN|nr:response regulator transcription factor [Micromonospora pallida]SCL29860.1 DNA-binding response regulator, NarL/FixJ family, contains REC and HTH domains [Micromonospora pallida]